MTIFWLPSNAVSFWRYSNVTSGQGGALNKWDRWMDGRRCRGTQPSRWLKGEKKHTKETIIKHWLDKLALNICVCVWWRWRGCSLSFLLFYLGWHQYISVCSVDCVFLDGNKSNTQVDGPAHILNMGNGSCWITSTHFKQSSSLCAHTNCYENINGWRRRKRTGHWLETKTNMNGRYAEISDANQVDRAPLLHQNKCVVLPVSGYAQAKKKEICGFRWKQHLHVDERDATNNDGGI